MHVDTKNAKKIKKKCRVCQLQATWSGKSSTRNFGFIHSLLIRSLVNLQSNSTLSMIFLHGFVLLSQDNIIICVITITSNIYGFKQKWKLRQIILLCHHINIDRQKKNLMWTNIAICFYIWMISQCCLFYAVAFCRFMSLYMWRLINWVPWLSIIYKIFNSILLFFIR